MEKHRRSGRSPKPAGVSGAPSNADFRAGNSPVRKPALRWRFAYGWRRRKNWAAVRRRRGERCDRGTERQRRSILWPRVACVRELPWVASGNDSATLQGLHRPGLRCGESNPFRVEDFCWRLTQGRPLVRPTLGWNLERRRHSPNGKSAPIGSAAVAATLQLRALAFQLPLTAGGGGRNQRRWLRPPPSRSARCFPQVSGWNPASRRHWPAWWRIGEQSR